ncbi:unnamed protein product [Rhizophagus irregularis]|nr:unnamed protein product [Rhizophagus irregularis]
MIYRLVIKKQKKKLFLSAKIFSKKTKKNLFRKYGNNKKNKKASVNISSQIPTQEFVEKFTAAFTDILRTVLSSAQHYSKDEFTAKVTKKLVPGGDLVRPATHADTFPIGPLTAEVFYGIISGARLKARQLRGLDKQPYRQQLDSLSSRYQNSLPALAKKLQPQHSTKGKQKDQSNLHVSTSTYANPVIDESMNIDESADPSIAVSQPNQEGNLGSTQSTSSTTTPIGTSPPNVITQSEEKNKKSKITRLTLNNNVVHDSQQGQVLEISFKPQHKYQSVWTKMILRPIIDTDFVMRTWYQKLDDLDVRWYPGHWKLKDRKERERFQAKLTIPSDASDNQLKNYWNGQTFEIFVQKTLKTKSYNTIIDKGLRQVIMYFESQKDLHAALAIQQIWKLTESHSPIINVPSLIKTK